MTHRNTHVAVTRACEALIVRPGCCDKVRVCVHAWCVCVAAEFHVSETPCGRVTDPKKLAAIKQVLSLPEHTGAQQGESVSSEAAQVHTCQAAGLSFAVRPPSLILLPCCARVLR